MSGHFKLKLVICYVFYLKMLSSFKVKKFGSTNLYDLGAWKKEHGSWICGYFHLKSIPYKT